MNYRKLGKSNLLVSEIGFGCMSLGEDKSENIKLLREAKNNGINYFDTADLYQKGQNEVIIGKAFRNVRKEVIIATKVGNKWRDDYSGWDWNPGKSYILQAVEQSLKRLHTDYIDLYQLHGGTIDDPIDDTISAFELLKQQGKIRHYGISSIRPNVIREYINRSEIISVMMQYSLLDRRPEESCLKLLANNNIGVLARGTLAKGLLIDKSPIPYLNYSTKEVENTANAVISLSKNNRSAVNVALGFVFKNSAINSSVVGIHTSEQLDTILGYESIPISENEYELLKGSIVANTYDQHR